MAKPRFPSQIKTTENYEISGFGKARKNPQVRNTLGKPPLKTLNTVKVLQNRDNEILFSKGKRMDIQLNGSKFNAEGMAKKMPVLKTLQNPSKSAKIKNSRQAYPCGIVHMV